MMDECKKAWDEYLWPDVDYCMTKGSWEIWQAAWNAKPVAAEVPVTSVEEAKPSVVRGRRCRECGGCETVTHADGVTACYWCQAPQPTPVAKVPSVEVVCGIQNKLRDDILRLAGKK